MIARDRGSPPTLGSLPHDTKWIDPTGKDPLGLQRLQLSQAER